MAGSQETRDVEGWEQARIQINLSPLRRLMHRGPGSPRRDVEPFVKAGQSAADLGCRKGYYTLALAECVGPEGRVYAVDLDENVIRLVEAKADERGYRNIQAHVSSAADLSFIKDGSVDFVLANGLLCSMADQRESAVNEIRRVLKSTGLAYLSLGMPPPFGFVNRAEWERILEGFSVMRRGQGLRVKWALVSAK